MYNEALLNLANIDCAEFQNRDMENVFAQDKSLFDEPQYVIQNDYSNQDESKKNKVEFAAVGELAEQPHNKYAFSEILMSQTLFDKTQQILVVYKECPIEFIHKSEDERS